MKKEIIQSESVRYERRTEVTGASGQAILFEQFGLLKKTWLWIMIIAVLATAGTAFYVFTYIPVEYKSSLVALPPNKSGTPLDNLVGGLASSLKDFGGLAKLAGKSSMENGYSRSVLLTSRSLMDSLIVKYRLYDVYKEVPRDHPEQMYDKLATNVEIDISPDGPITITVYDTDPKRASAMAADVIAFTNAIARNLNQRETEPISRFVGDRYEKAREDQGKLSRQLSEFMSRNKIYDPETQAGAASVEFMKAEANVSAQRSLVALYSQALGDADPKTIQAREMLRQYEIQSQKMAAGKGGAIGTLGLKQLPGAMVDYLRIRQDYEVNAKVLALLEPLYEQTKYDAVKDIPVLNVLDAPFSPSKKARPKRTLILATAFLGTFVVAYVIIALLAYLRHFLGRYRSYVNGGSGVPEIEVAPKRVGELNDGPAE